jgi:FHA domain
MIKCPFCHFDNEDGALFCEQCKSDLSGVTANSPEPLEAVPLAAEAIPIEALPIEAEPIPALALEAFPMAGEVVEAYPMAAEPIMEAAPVIMEATPVAMEAAPVIMEATPVAAEAMPVIEAMPAFTPAPPPPPPVIAAPAPQPPPMAPPPPAPAPITPAAAATLPPGAQPCLLVLRGQKRNVEYPIYEGLNFVGRADDKPVDIDLEDQEPPDRVWCSRQHACISFEADQLAIEDLNSANGTYVNRARIYPGQKRNLVPNDIVQIGNVQLKVVVK